MKKIKYYIAVLKAKWTKRLLKEAVVEAILKNSQDKKRYFVLIFSWKDVIVISKQRVKKIKNVGGFGNLTIEQIEKSAYFVTPH